MSVEQVKLLYDSLKTITKHFESSVKNKEKLNECMQMMNLTPIHLISWCTTRMAHFLEACVVFEEMLVPIHDTMFSLNIRNEERDVLFTAENLYTLKIMCDIYKDFHHGYVRMVDKSSLLVSTVFKIAQETADNIESIKTPKADAFLNGLEIDNNGNLTAKIDLNGDIHTFNLNRHSKPSRTKTKEEVLNDIKKKLEEIKQEIVNNIKENIKDQCGEDTHFYSWSGMNLEDTTLTIEDRIKRLNDLITMFCTEKIHLVSEYANKKETETKECLWKGYKVNIFQSSCMNSKSACNV